MTGSVGRRTVTGLSLLAAALSAAGTARAEDGSDVRAHLFFQDSFFESFSARLADQLDQRMRHARRSGGGLHVNGLQGPEAEWRAYRAAALYDPEVALQFSAAEAERDLAREQEKSPFGPAMALPPGLGIFLLGDTGLGEAHTAKDSDSSFWVHSISGGMDYRFADALLAGFAVSHSGGEADLGGIGYLSGSMTWSLFASLGQGPWHIDGSFNMGTLGFGGVREAASVHPGVVTHPVSAGDHVWTHVDAGYAFRFGNLEAGPVAEFRRAKAHFDGFSDGGVRTMTLEGREMNYARLGVGAAASIDVNFGERKTMNIWGRATYETGFGDSDPAFEAALEDGGPAVLIQGIEADRSFLRTLVGFTADLGEGAEADVSYRTDFGRTDWDSHTLAASIRIRF